MTFDLQLAAFGLMLFGRHAFGAYLYGEKMPEGGAQWSYHGSKGPEYWCNLSPLYSDCCGKNSQSPVDINIAATKYPANHFTYENYDAMPNSMTLFNNGHTVLLKSESVADGTPAISFHLHSSRRVYEIDEVHFHWGKVSSRGSEHTFDHALSPMEMHAVHKMPGFQTLYDATKHSDSIAVIGVFFEISEHDNPKLNNLIEGLKLVRNAEVKMDIPPFKYTDIFPSGNDYFFSYNGSLTTPPCSETVTWFVLNTKVPISEAQLNEFRQLREKPEAGDPSNALPLVDNYRPQQNLNGRSIFSSMRHYGQ